MKSVALVSRPKLNGLGRHYGVLIDNTTCYDLQPIGIRKLTLDEFAEGHAIRREQEIPASPVILRRLQHLSQKPLRYGLLKFNCESFARYLLTGKAESKQIRYLAASSLGATLVYYLLGAPLLA
jgi:hypothetical protein